MSQKREDDDLEPEYDFSGAVRGKYYQRFQQGTNVVLLDPDVAQAFKDSESVNRTLRLLLDLVRQEVPRAADPGTPCGGPEELARQVPAETGESLTEAIIHSLEERLERLKGTRSAPDLAEALMAISRRSSSLPEFDTRDADEILGYDEEGSFR
jgi:hypothetical protein